MTYLRYLSIYPGLPDLRFLGLPQIYCTAPSTVTYGTWLFITKCQLGVRIKNSLAVWMHGLTVLPLCALKMVCSGQAGQTIRSLLDVTFQKENDKLCVALGLVLKKEPLVFLWSDTITILNWIIWSTLILSILISPVYNYSLHLIAKLIEVYRGEGGTCPVSQSL